MLIDFHTHVFPHKLAARALQNLSFVSGGLQPYTDGTPEGLLAAMDREGVDRSVVLNIATNAHQMHAVNDFAASINGERLIAFGSVHPDAEDALDELDRIKALGLKGVKFHPDYQKFFVDDPKVFPLYKKISDLGLITVFHAGFDFGFAPPYKCMPQNALKMLDHFTTPVVLAHWGGLSCGEEVVSTLCGRNVYFDVSFGYGVMPRSTALAIVEKHGADKLLFGTDSPWHTPSMERTLLSTLGLTDQEFNKICYLNALNLLK